VAFDFAVPTSVAHSKFRFNATPAQNGPQRERAGKAHSAHAGRTFHPSLRADRLADAVSHHGRGGENCRAGAPSPKTSLRSGDPDEPKGARDERRNPESFDQEDLNGSVQRRKTTEPSEGLQFGNGSILSCRRPKARDPLKLMMLRGLGGGRLAAIRYLNFRAACGIV
jgi:hypothetical protein